MKKFFLTFYRKSSLISIILSFGAILSVFTFSFVQVVEAVPIFNINTADKVVNISPGDTTNVLYTIRNNSGLDIADTKYIPSYFVSISSSSTCPTNLLKNETCNLVLTLHAPQKIESFFLTTFRVCGFSGQMCSILDKNNHIKMNIVEITQGHFVFRQGATDITTLDLAPNATGSVTLHNTGGSPISAYNLNVPAAIDSYFTGTCRSVSSLAAGASCNLAYTIPASPVTGGYNLTANGTNADNSPHTLVVNINLPTPRAYFAVYGAREVWQCEVNGSGDFINCGNTGGNQYYLPTDIAFNAAGTRAFITNFQSNLGAYITKCEVDPNNGTFSSCGDTNASGFGFSNGIALNTAGTVAIVVNGASIPSNSTVYRCDVNVSTGDFSGCANTGIPGALVNAPAGVTLDNSNAKAYVANYNNQNIIACDMGATGSLSNCITSGIGVSGLPNDITLNANGTMAFITLPFSPMIVYCQVNSSTGALSGCANTNATGITKPNYIKLNQAGTLAFITDSDGNRIIRCNVNTTTGAFSGCTNTGATGFTNPQGIVLQGV